MPLVRYIAGLTWGRMILWCYLAWYLNALVRLFDPSPSLWLTSLGIAAIVGVALLLSTTAGADGVRLRFWPTARLFLMPFCVSSFAALVKGRGYILIFPPGLRENLVAAGCCAALCLGVLVVKRFAPCGGR
jgi:hypothetical protein